MRIRKVRVGDLKKIIEIEYESFDHPYPPALLEFLILNNRNHFFVAEDRDIVGYVCGMYRGEEGHLISVAVLEKFRRRGIGTKLCEKIIDVFKKENCLWVKLEVRCKNKKAISMYEKLGFEKVGVLKHYYENGDDAVIMRKKI